MENEYHDPADKQDQITLEQIRDGEGDNVENQAPGTGKRGPQKKRKQIEQDDFLAQVCIFLVSPNSRCLLLLYLLYFSYKIKLNEILLKL